MRPSKTAILSILAAAVSAQRGTTTLQPIVSGDGDKTDLEKLVPSNKIQLQYGTSQNPLVNVSLGMSFPAVLLETVNAVASVTCSPSSVAVVFSNFEAFDITAKEWSALDNFVLVTNHLGDCDEEFTRGFFLADGITTNADSLTVVANALKTDVATTAASAEIDFSNVPLAGNPNKRDITVNQNGVTISNNISIANEVIYSYAPYFSVTANEADLGMAITLSGHLDYNIFEMRLEQLTFDIDTEVAASLDLTFAVTAPYNGSFSYAPADLASYFVNVPGIITIGPVLGFDIGVDLSASAAVMLTTDLTIGIQDGQIHLDLVDAGNSFASGWMPTHTEQLTISEQAAVGISPFVDLTVEIEIEVFGGLLDLSTGLTAQPSFNNEFVLTATQDIKRVKAARQADPSGSCEQGLEIQSGFLFSLTAFVSGIWSDVLYSVDIPIADECYSWT